MTVSKPQSLPVPGICRWNDGDHHDPGCGHAATGVRREVRPRRGAARGRRDAGDGARERQPLGDARPGLGQHPPRGRERRARPPGLRPRERLPRELCEPEAAGQQAQQGVPDSPARRPHGRHHHALRELLEGRPGGRTDLRLGAQRDRASPGHAALRRSRSRKRSRGTPPPGTAPSTRTA